MTLPIFTFDVVTTDVTAHLLHQNNPKFKRHQWATVTVSNHEFEKTPEQVQCWPKETLRVLFYEVEIPTSDGYNTI